MNDIYRKYFKKVALIWAGCLVLFFFVYIFVLAPQKKSKKQVGQQLAERKQLYNAAQEATQEETKLKLNEQIERLQNKLRDFAIDSEDSADLIFDISQIANEKKVASFSVKMRDGYEGSATSNCNHIFEKYIGVSFNAGFNQFAALLNALERHRPIIFVDRFAIERSEQGDSNHKVKMNLAVFVRKRLDS